MTEKDLFGRKIRPRKTRTELYLLKFDRETFPGRLDRLIWIKKVFPKGSGMLASPETVYIFEEIKMTFLNGQYISTIILVSSFLEHWLGGILRGKGYMIESQGGLKSIIECMRDNSILHEFLLDKADRIRAIRNPFVHLKGFDHDERIIHRAIKKQTDPFVLLEADARESVILAYQIVAFKTG